MRDELLGFLGFLRERVLGPLALAAAGHPPHGVRKIERYLPEFSTKLRATVGAYDAASCYTATLAAVELYRALREPFAAGELVVRSDAEAQSMDFLRSVGEKTEGAVSPPP